MCISAQRWYINVYAYDLNTIICIYMHLQMYVVLLFLHQVCSGASVLSTAAIAFDRYNTIVNCFRHSASTSDWYIIRGIASIYIPSIAVSILVIWLPEQDSVGGPIWSLYDVNIVRFRVYSSMFFITMYLCPLLLISYCYWRVLCVARNHMRKIAISPQVNDDGKGPSQGGNGKGVVAIAMVEPIQRLSLYPDMLAEQMREVIDHISTVASLGPGVNYFYFAFAK